LKLHEASASKACIFPNSRIAPETRSPDYGKVEALFEIVNSASKCRRPAHGACRFATQTGRRQNQKARCKFAQHQACIADACMAELVVCVGS
jgi:hypothetical protein